MYSKTTGKRRPASTVTRNKEPNLELMAKVIMELYEQKRIEENENKHRD